jgi:PfaD family protein
LSGRIPLEHGQSVSAGPLGWWRGAGAPRAGREALCAALERVQRPIFVVQRGGEFAVTNEGVATLGTDGAEPSDGWPLVGYAAPLGASGLGDSRFRTKYCCEYAYVAGEMANGIASEEMIIALGREGWLGFFGAAGLEPGRVDRAIERIRGALSDRPWGSNLIHSPAEPRREAEVVELYLRRGVRVVSASAYLDLTLPLVHYRVSGIARRPDGSIVAPNAVMAKVSRIEVARKFLSPPPAAMLAELVRRQQLTPQQAEWAGRIPMCDDLTAEADSGGHTDNRPALALLPTMLALRDRLQAQFGFDEPVRVGLAGGIATPESVAAAFAMGAAYVMTGSINQACREAGTSDAVRQMLAEAGQADVAMAPAADMFEMGVKVQVLKRGTMFALRAQKLYELYRSHDSIEALPAAARQTLERDYFRAPLEEVWRMTRDFFATRDPAQIERAEREPKHKLALVFRSYLGQSSNWANTGDPTRKLDYQVWCGPAMGAFNEWVRGSFLESPEQRDVVTVAMNLMVGAAVLTRAGMLRSQGVPLPPEAAQFRPRPRAVLSELTGAATDALTTMQVA